METINLIANKDPKSPVSEAYRTIRTNIKFANVSGKELKTIMLTSSEPNEGKSTTISNLAAVMAQSGSRVLVVDCDMRNPTQHKIFQVSNHGLSDCISARDNVMSYVQQTEVDNLYVLTAGPIAPNPSEILGSQVMIDILKAVEESFDYVLVDTPPVLPVTDAAVVGGIVDGVILVIASGSTSPANAKEAKARLEKGGARILGVVLNKVDVAHSHSYDYYYYYGHDEKNEK